MAQDYQYIELSFINDFEEIKRQIKNTVAISYLLNNGFNETTLNSYLESTQYGYTASASEIGTHLLVRITDIISGEVNWSNVPHCNCDNEEKYLLSKGDILVARTGGTTGKSFLINSAPSNAIFASYLIRLRVNKANSPEFISIFLNSYAFWSQIAELKSGSAQPNVNAEKLKTLLIPECPPNIQNRISQILNSEISYVEDNFTNELKNKIDLALSRVNQLELLKKEIDFQQTHLELLRQAIVQDAVEGKLSVSDHKELREHEFKGSKEIPEFSNFEKHTSDEDALTLLQRIKVEKQLLISAGKLKKEEELLPINENEIPYELPKGWVWCRLQDISNNIHYGFNAPANNNKKEVRLLRITDIQNNKVNWEDVPGCIITEKEFRNYKLEENDIMIARTGGTIGKSYIVKNLSVNAVFASYLIRVIPSKIVDANYLKLFIESPLYWKQLIELSSGTGQPNVNGTSLKSLITPLPPLSEQHRIVEKVLRLLQIVNQLEQQVTDSQSEAKQLLRMMLNETFGGSSKQIKIIIVRLKSG